MSLTRLRMIALAGGCLLSRLGFIAAAEASGSEPSAAPRTLNTPRSFPNIKSQAEWQARAKEIREQVLVSCGLWPMPERTPLKARIFGKIERDGYSIEKVHFHSLPGFYVAGNLYRPLGKGRGPFPGVLNPHGHWKEGRLVDTGEGSVAARCISFARQGMVAFCYDMVGYNDTRFADSPTNAPLYQTHRQFGTNRADLLWNISLMGLQTWNSIRALDFLESLPDVDKSRLACTGASGGGTQTFILGAIDDRLAAQAPVVMVSHSMQGGCSCENAPGLRVEYSNMEIAAAAAPRPQILVAATGDWTKATMTVEGPAINGIYELFNAPAKFRYQIFDFGHNYNQTSREAVYEWFGKWLLKHPDPASLKEAAYTKEPDDALRVWPDGKLPDDALTKEETTALLISRAQGQLDALRPTTRRSLEKYKQVVLPAWQHTFQVHWPQTALRSIETRRVSFADFAVSDVEILLPDDGARISAILFNPTSQPPARSGLRPGGRRKAGTAVVLASTDDASAFYDSSGAPGEIVKRLLQQGHSAILLANLPTNQPHDQFANFFTTYNRTLAQERVRDLIAACSYAKSVRGASRVVLCGFGRAGLWTLLAAPAADAVAADCDQLDVANDEALLAPDLFCPGIRNIGAFEGAAMLAAPHPLLLHNTGDAFPTKTFDATYAALGANRRLRIESGRPPGRRPVAKVADLGYRGGLSEDELVNWISQMK